MLASGLALVSLLVCREADADSHNPSVAVRNVLAECIDVSLGAPRKDRNLVLLPATVRFRKSIAECGCTSAVILYRILERKGGSERDIFSGKLNSRSRVGKTEQLNFLLSTDDKMWTASNVLLHLACGDLK